MIDITVFLTVTSGFHYAWVASQRIGLVTDSGIDAMPIHNPDRR
jgi:hypothetical protein